jgi:hypothetical protein
VNATVDTARGTAGPTAHGSSLTDVRMVALGMLMLQLTWVFAVPPFRGSDEFDHVYRAAAAARGQWFVTPTDATRGTGAWLTVPSDLVEAARPQCQALRYTSDVDCVGYPHDGTTRIASGAGRYHPLFYALVGAPALPFKGHAAVYVMRVATVGVSWLLFCLALGATRRWALTPWPTAVLALASTPVLIYSSSIVAPNGVEMMAGLAFWSAALGLLRVRSRQDRLLLGAAVLSGSVLVTVRPLGPFWCLLIVITALIATRTSWSSIRALASQSSYRLAAAIVAMATVLSAAWTLGMHTLNVAQDTAGHISTGTRLDLLLGNEPAWMLQSIAAFPLRNEATRTPVYACYLALFIVLTYLGFSAARALSHASIAVAIAVAVVVPYAVPFVMGLNQASDPRVWQGRYALPYSVGILLLIGFALDLCGRRLTTPLRGIILLLFVAAQSIGPVDVLRKSELRPLSDYSTFPHPPAALLAATATLGATLLWLAASHAPPESSR